MFKKVFAPRNRKIIILLVLIISVALTSVISKQQQYIQQNAAVSSSKLGVFALSRCSAANTIIDGGPKILKIAVGVPPDQNMVALMRDYKAKYPTGIVVYRVYDDLLATGQTYKKTDDPIASADNYFNRFIKLGLDSLSSSDRALIDYVAGDNEFTAFDLYGSLSPLYDASNWEWYAKFWSRLADKTASYGKKALVAELPVGHPIDVNLLRNTITHFNHIAQIGGALSYHGYTRDYTTDVAGETDNDSLMYRRIYDYFGANNGPTSMKLILGEAGVDKSGNGATDGWLVRGDANKYKNWLQWYDSQLKQDSYVTGATIFTLCGGSNWSSFNIDTIADWLKGYLGGTGTVPPTSRPTIPPPPGATNTPVPPPGQSRPPIGFLDNIDGGGILRGWTRDPDLPSAIIQAHFWVDGPEGQGRYAGTTLASRSRGDPAVDPHAFEFIIPNQFRDGQTHQIYGYGLDLQGVTNGHLSSSPLSFNLRDSAPPDPTNVPPPPGNPNPQTQPPTDPSGLRYSCNLANRTVRLQWSPSERTDFYFLHIRGATTRDERVYATYYTMPIELGRQYSWWMEAVNHDANYNPRSTDSVGGPSFNCNYPPIATPTRRPTPTGVGAPPIPPTATPIPPTPTPAIPAFVPNCSHIQGPTTIKLGQSGTYLAQYSGPLAGELFGVINAVNIIKQGKTPWDWNIWPPSKIPSNSGSLSFTWTPTATGVYQVFCRAINGNIAECRGAPNTVSGPPLYTCPGPEASMTVNVTSSAIDDGQSGTNMCQFATVIGGEVMTLGENVTARNKTVTPNRPLIISAIAKPRYNIKNYTFAFYNLANLYPNPTPPFDVSPKPIQFTANTDYIVNSTNNTITVTYNDLNKVDQQTGRKPSTIQVNAYFTDTEGNFSSVDPKCVVTLHVANPTNPTVVTPTTPPLIDVPDSVRNTLVLVLVGLMVLGIVSVYFFFH